MEYSAIDVMKSKINKGITTVSVKTTSSVEKAKLTIYLETLTTELDKLHRDLGCKTFTLWNSGNLTMEKIENDLAEIRKKKELISEVQQEIDMIDARERQILGGMSSSSSDTDYICMCPKCLEERQKGTKFCIRCGAKNVEGQRGTLMKLSNESRVDKWTCKRCLEENVAEHKFCGTCGSPKVY